MLYKLIIVEDEETIRNGLCKIIDWASLGYQVVSCFEDGNEALDYLEKFPVDVVLTDIKLTLVSGLEVAKYLYECKPHIKIVVISGFKDFEYAKQAISYNVEHYLLKPTSILEIKDVFVKIRRQMDMENEYKQMIEKQQNSYKEMVSFLREQFFADIVSGALKNRTEIIRRAALLDYEENEIQNRCCILNIEVCDYENHLENNWNYGKENFVSAMRNFLQIKKDVIEWVPIFITDQNICIFALNVDVMDIRGNMHKIPMKNSESMEERVKTCFNSIRSEIKATLGIDFKLIDCTFFNSCFEIAEKSGSFTIIKNKGLKEILIKSLIDKKDYHNLVEQQKLFVTHVCTGHVRQAKDMYDKFLNQLTGMKMDVIQNFVIDLFAILFNRMKDVDMVAFLDIRKNFDYTEILQLKTIEDIRTWGQSVIDSIEACIKALNDTIEYRVISKTKKYIDEHFSEDISLYDIADHVFLSPIYFSRFFKEKTGENYIDYLTKVRMNKAKQLLLHSRFKAQEISTMVGYCNTKYFYKLFKRYTGYTPTEYRHYHDSHEEVKNVGKR